MTTLVEYGTRCLYEDTDFYSILIVRSASWLKRKSSHFRKCCEDNFYLCVRLVQNHMEIFSTTAKLFVWRLRLRVQKEQSPHYWHTGGKNLKSFTHYKYLVIELNAELPDDKHIQRQLRYQYCAANKLQASFSRHSNTVENAQMHTLFGVGTHLFSLVTLLEDLDFSFQFLREAPGAS